MTENWHVYIETHTGSLDPTKNLSATILPTLEAARIFVAKQKAKRATGCMIFCVFQRKENKFVDVTKTDFSDLIWGGEVANIEFWSKIKHWLNVARLPLSIPLGEDGEPTPKFNAAKDAEALAQRSRTIEHLLTLTSKYTS